MGRRELAVAVLLGATGAVLALVALRQTWVVEVSQRPAPFPPERIEATGGDLRGWVPALAWAALAGAGALLATRATPRRLVGGLLVVAGAAVAVGALSAAAPVVGWPLVAAAGGLMVALAGAAAGVRSARWPGMGARYQRKPRRSSGGDSPETFWAALDRGEDPTAR